MPIPTHPATSAEDLKSALAGFCTGVAVITAPDADGRPAGMAVQSFSSVSLDPPLVCFCPAHTSTTWPRIRAAGRFAVNVLAEDQRELCRPLRGDGRRQVRGHTLAAGRQRRPLLDGALATIECELADVLDGGDHAIALGRVTSLTTHRDAGPLLYFRRTYGRLPRSSSSMSASMASARSRSDA